MPVKNYLHVLISPDNQSKLNFNSNNTCLVSTNDQHTYAIEGGVPLLLQKDAYQQFASTQQHEQLNTQFFYIEHYKVDAEEFDYFMEYESAATVHEIRRLHESIISEVPKDTKSILDVGCGKAWVAQHFCPKGVTVCSFDIALTNTEKALKKYPYDNHFAVVGDAFNLPFQPNSFDCIIASEIIEHVPAPKQFMTSLLTALKPGGQLIITTPFNEKLNYSLCIHCNRPTPEHAHIHSFTIKKMLNFVPKEKIKTLRIYTFGNKALIKLRTHILLKYLPHGFWKGVDKLANKLWFKPTRILLKLEK